MDGKVDGPAVPIRASRGRFVVLAVFSGATFLSAFAWICFSSVFTVVADRYRANALQVRRADGGSVLVSTAPPPPGGGGGGGGAPGGGARWGPGPPPPPPPPAPPPQVNALSLTYMIAYAPGCVLAAPITARWGLRGSVVGGLVLLALCTVVRAVGDAAADPTVAYGVVLTGQLFGALGQPLLLNAPTRIAADWFPASERDAATVVGTMANAIGNAAGVLVPPFVVAGQESPLRGLLIGQAVPTVVLLVISALFVTSRPEHPPSLAAAVQWGVQHQSPAAVAPEPVAAAPSPAIAGPTAAGMPQPVVVAPRHSATMGLSLSEEVHEAPRPPAVGEGGKAPTAAAGEPDAPPPPGQLVDAASAAAVVVVWPPPPSSGSPPSGGGTMTADAASAPRALLGNRNFMLLLGAFSVTVGMSWALLTVLAQLMQPCGYSDTVVGVAGAVFLLAGVLPSLAIVPALQKWHAYVTLQRVALVASLVGTFLVLVVNQPGIPLGGMYAAYAAYGVMFMPILPLTLEHAAEVTFPCPADTAAAWLLTGANVVGAVFTFVLTPLLEMPVSLQCASVVTPTAGLVLGSMALAAAAGAPLVRDYRRRAVEQQQAA
jgi:MFS family permease